MIHTRYPTLLIGLLCSACAPVPAAPPPSDLPSASTTAAQQKPDDPTALPSEEQARRFTLGRRLTAAHAGPSPAALEVLTLSSSSRFGRDRHSHLYVVVLAGQAEVVAEASKQRVTLSPWHALWAPGVGVTLKGRDARVLLAFVSGAEGGSRYDASPERSWEARPAPGKLVVRNLAAAPVLSWAGGKMHARLGFEQGPASLSLLYGAAQIGVPPHRHQAEWEVIGLLRTSGTFRHGVEAEGSLQQGASASVESGMTVAVQPPLEHTFKPDGKTPLFAVQLYVPPGPEQRFKQLAGQSSVAPTAPSAAPATPSAAPTAPSAAPAAPSAAPSASSVAPTAPSAAPETPPAAPKSPPAAPK